MVNFKKKPLQNIHILYIIYNRKAIRNIEKGGFYFVLSDAFHGSSP